MRRGWRSIGRGRKGSHALQGAAIKKYIISIDGLLFLDQTVYSK
jgi:hypothetical protein